MFLKEQRLGRALGRTSRGRPMSTEHLKGFRDVSFVLRRLYKKSPPCGVCSQPLKCYSDVPSSNEISLAETPPGGLCVTTNTSVIAALKSRGLNDLFEQVCTAAKFSRSGSRRILPLRVHLKKVPAPVNVLLLDSLHRELKAKLRKQDRAAIEQVV